MRSINFLHVTIRKKSRILGQNTHYPSGDEIQLNITQKTRICLFFSFDNIFCFLRSLSFASLLYQRVYFESKHGTFYILFVERILATKSKHTHLISFHPIFETHPVIEIDRLLHPSPKTRYTFHFLIMLNLIPLCTFVWTAHVYG